jgi:hypothetical protein
VSTVFSTTHPLRLSLLACCAALVAGCASGPPKAERYVAPPVGASWKVQVSSTGSFGNANKVEQQVSMRDVVLEGKPYHRFDSGSGAVLQNDSVAVFMVLGPGDRPLMRYDPPLGYQFPLEVGKTWTQDIALTVGGVNKVPMKAEWKVEAYEDVTVPAGTFKAWRVALTDNFGFKQTTWSMPETAGVYAKRVSERPATHPQGGAGTQVIELLTLPAVK